MQQVLVTGGSGFIGGHVVDALLKGGYRVTRFDRRDTGFDASLTSDLFLGDMRDGPAVAEAMGHCDSWIHLAGVLGTQETIANPLAAAETNVLGGLNILQAAAQYKTPGVYIAVGNHWMDNTYSITKTTVERFCHMYRVERGLPVSVVRTMNAYGPRQVAAAPYGPSKVRKIMPSFVCRALSNHPIEIYGDGSQIMDMVYVEDVAETLITALERTVESGGVDGVVECGTGRPTTVKDIADAVINAVGQGYVSYLPMRPGEPEKSVVLADTTTLSKIGMSTKGYVQLEEGVALTVSYFANRLVGDVDLTDVTDPAPLTLAQ